jgi:hypothetical protein
MGDKVHDIYMELSEVETDSDKSKKYLLSKTFRVKELKVAKERIDRVWKILEESE